VGYDINYSRVLEIRSNKDVTLELTEKELKNVNGFLGAKNLDQAKKFLANGGMMKTLEEKYTITDSVRSELVSD